MAENLVERLGHDGITRLWIVYADYSGVTHAKIVPPERFHDAIERGIGFANANMDFTILDQQVPTPLLAADTGDFLAVPDPTTFAPLPYATGHGRVFAFLHSPDTSRWAGCPRTALETVVARYAERGLLVQAAFEPECNLFVRTEHGPVPADTSRMFSVEGLDIHLDLVDSLMEGLGRMGIVLEQVGLNTDRPSTRSTWSMTSQCGPRILCSP